MVWFAFWWSSGKGNGVLTLLLLQLLSPDLDTRGAHDALPPFSPSGSIETPSGFCGVPKNQKMIFIHPSPGSLLLLNLTLSAYNF